LPDINVEYPAVPAIKILGSWFRIDQTQGRYIARRISWWISKGNIDTSHSTTPPLHHGELPCDLGLVSVVELPLTRALEFAWFSHPTVFLLLAYPMN
jgi:hypothetical protein